MKCPYKNAHAGTCMLCQEKYKMPSKFCCLTECGEHEFCRNCTQGAYLKGDK